MRCFVVICSRLPCSMRARSRAAAASATADHVVAGVPSKPGAARSPHDDRKRSSKTLSQRSLQQCASGIGGGAAAGGAGSRSDRGSRSGGGGAAAATAGATAARLAASSARRRASSSRRSASRFRAATARARDAAARRSSTSHWLSGARRALRADFSLRALNCSRR